MLEISPISKILWRNKIAAFLIITQLTLTIAIISNAVFFIYQRQVKIDRPTGIATNELISLVGTKVAADLNFEISARNDVEFIRTIPGVIDATLISNIPLSGGGSSSSFAASTDDDSPTTIGNQFRITEHGISTLGMSLIEGRNFTPEEVFFYNEQAAREDGAVAIVSKKFAEDMFPDESAIGQVIYKGNGQANTIIGVIDHMMGSWPNQREEYGAGQIVLIPALDLSYFTRILIRTAEEDRGALMLTIVEALRDRESGRLIGNEMTMEDTLKGAYTNDYAMIKILFTVVVLLALVNALGIVGLTTFWVNQRRKEIGIRRALGATKAAIVRYFIVENALLCTVAAVLGGGLSLMASDYLVREFSLKLLPWQVVLGTAFTVLILTMLAATAPAIKASQVSPAEATA